MLYGTLSCSTDARKHIAMLHQLRGEDFNMIALIDARKNINATHTHDERRPRRTTEKRICFRFWRKLCYLLEFQAARLVGAATLMGGGGRPARREWPPWSRPPAAGQDMAPRGCRRATSAANPTRLLAMPDHNTVTSTCSPPNSLPWPTTLP